MAIVGMYPYGGSIRGRAEGNWESEPIHAASEPHRLSLRSRSESPSEQFANPYSTLKGARAELAALLHEALHETQRAEAAGDHAARNVPPGTVTEAPSANTEPRTDAGTQTETGERIALVALFTGPVEQLRIPPIPDALFSTMTIEDAVSRSIVHTPNLLRAADIPGLVYSGAEQERIYDLLERSAQTQERVRESRSETPTAHPVLPLRNRPWWKLSPKWLLPIGLALALLIVFVIRASLRPELPSAPTPPKEVSHPPSEIIIQTPIETELFVSPTMFQTRRQLDRALRYGDGERFLPDTEQRIVRDSLSLAKGLYGYFRVDNAWRKGMLLQTLQPIDTITIVKFMDPLP